MSRFGAPLAAGLMAAALVAGVAQASQPAQGFGTIACGNADSAGLCRLQVTLTDASGNASTVPTSPSSGSFTDCSGLLSPATAVTLITASTGTNYRFVLNPPSAGGSIWVSTTGAAAVNGESSGSVELKVGASYVWSGNYIPTNALSAIGTSSGQKATCTRG